MIGQPGAATVLATTALEQTWGQSEPILFLGEWCKRYGRRDIWSRRAHQTVPFHWDDRGKLDRDYAYLDALHKRVLGSLAEALNRRHQVDCGIRYWQLLLDPWLLSYLGVAFDRWESLRVAFASHTNLEAEAAVGAAAAPFSYLEFLDAAFSDTWNQQFCQRIIESEHADCCVIRPATAAPGGRPAAVHGAAPIARRSPLGAAVAALDGVLGRLAPRHDVVFLGTGFSLPTLLRLNVALGQVPRLFLDDFAASSERDLPAASVDAANRDNFSCEFQPESRFEEFLERSIADDLPSSVLEHYAALQERAGRVAIGGKTIVTNSRHWHDVAAKFWLAGQVTRGAKLVIAEHGGSLPSRNELFDFDLDVADVKATWFMPYHPKHAQLPPPKLVGRFGRPAPLGPSSPRQFCSVVGNECPRWVYRVHYYPMVKQWTASFDMVIDLHRRLDARIRQAVRIKPYPGDQGWNTRGEFVDVLGPESVLPEMGLDRVFAQSRVIVCTYPETTFAEAMASGVPTVLVYPPHLYELHPVAGPLLRTLMSANIVFHDSAAAAAHVSSIWDDPDGWWTSAMVRDARAEFQRQALDLSGDWLGKWTAFLRALTASGGHAPQIG